MKQIFSILIVTLLVLFLYLLFIGESQAGTSHFLKFTASRIQFSIDNGKLHECGYEDLDSLRRWFTHNFDMSYEYSNRKYSENIRNEVVKKESRTFLSSSLRIKQLQSIYAPDTSLPKYLISVFDETNDSIIRDTLLISQYHFRKDRYPLIEWKSDSILITIRHQQFAYLRNGSLPLCDTAELREALIPKKRDGNTWKGGNGGPYKDIITYDMSERLWYTLVGVIGDSSTTLNDIVSFTSTIPVQHSVKLKFLTEEEIAHRVTLQ